jgi:large repetitive protein
MLRPIEGFMAESTGAPTPPPTPATPAASSYWLHWARLNWIERNAAALRRRLLMRGRGPGLMRRLAQAAGAFALLLSMLLGHAPAPAHAALPAFSGPISDPFGLSDVGSYATPAFGDLDADGDLDALVGEANGNLYYFKNTSTTTTPAFAAPSSNPFGLVDVGSYSAPAFADVNADGDLDVISGNDGRHFWFFRNTANATSAGFSSFDLGDQGGGVLFTFADLDHDGDLERIEGLESGGVAVRNNNGDAVTASWLGAVTGAFGLPSAGFYDTPTFGDLDGDGDLDALVGDNTGALTYYQNTGTALAPAYAAPVAGAALGLTAGGTFSAPTLVDIDSDGDLDVLVGRSDGHVYLYVNNAQPVASAFYSPPEGNPFNLTSDGFRNRPDLVDIDHDGRLDAFIGDTVGDIRYFHNTGTALAPSFAAATTDPFGLSDVGDDSQPTFVDIDHDGRLDAFVGRSDGDLVYYHNTGTVLAPAFASPSTNPFGLANSGTYSVPAFVDIDGDGDLDLFVGMGLGTMSWYQNTGNAVAPAFTFFAPSTDFGDYSSPTFADMDHDGDFDLVVGSSSGDFVLVKNTGNARVYGFNTYTTNPFGLTNLALAYSAPVFVDINGDGRLDGFSGDGIGVTRFFGSLRTTFLPLALRQP